MIPYAGTTGVQPPLSLNGIKSEVVNMHAFSLNPTGDTPGDYTTFTTNDGQPLSYREPHTNPLVVANPTTIQLLLLVTLNLLGGEQGYTNYAAQGNYRYIGVKCEPCSLLTTRNNLQDRVEIAGEFDIIPAFAETYLENRLQAPHKMSDFAGVSNDVLGY